jgi:hypothetical protein
MVIEFGSVSPRKGNYFYQVEGYQGSRVYGDEIPLPDSEFCFNRMKYYADKKRGLLSLEPCYIWKIKGRELRYREWMLTKR